MTEAKAAVRTLRCAIYTRKSSEEGLEQSFNSIDAQREACEAYAVSQRHEGWKVLPTRYDDGGFSGGTLDRPAIQRLLADMQSGLVDLVVVYKIDRLTRALSDFAKMVDIFDAHNASFVSVTQHFNTTTSMGRLTLNVLLSFAQFEREVTGERIRDKIAASKKKGMWMGGPAPLGYDAIERKLVVNPAEAEQVRQIYARYLVVGDVRTLKTELDRKGIVGKRRLSRTGNSSGGMSMSRGALYMILKNRIYLGEVAHKGNVYPGEHLAIISHEEWQAVQDKLQSNSDGRKLGIKAKESSLLAGWVYDTHLNRLTPSHAVKRGKRYRYYVARPEPDPAGTWAPKISVPAHDLETTVVQAIIHWLKDVPTLLTDMKLKSGLSAVRQRVLQSASTLAETIGQAEPKSLRAILMPIMSNVKVGTDQVEIQLRRDGLDRVLGREGLEEAPDIKTPNAGIEEEQAEAEDEGRYSLDNPRIRVQARLQRCGVEMRLIVLEDWAKVEAPEVDWPLIRVLARSHRWMQQLISGEVATIGEIAKAEKVTEYYISRTLRCASLAPDIVEAILQGKQPHGLNVMRIVKSLPLSWRDQRKAFGMDGGHH